MRCCPSDEELAQFLDGQLAPARSMSIEEHLDACRSCHRELAELARVFASPTRGSPAIEDEPRVEDEPSAHRIRAPGTCLGRYQLLGILGIGGMGVVYRARDPVLDRLVAVKTLRRPPEGVAEQARLSKEARALASLSHPHVVEVFDVGTAGDDIYVAMEYLAGGDLRAWMTKDPRWPDILAVFGDAGRGLAAAHDVGLVHRDFKPDNLLFGADGRVRVVDFGLVAEAGQPSTAATGLERETRLVGTPAYMAPEQLGGAVADAHCDQFSFCVALHEAVYGRRPFVAPDPVLLRAKMQHPLGPPLGLLPGKTRRALVRGLSIDPSARYADMHALVEALSLPRGRRWITSSAAAAGTLTLTVLAWPVQSSRTGLCERAAPGMRTTWNEGTRRELEQEFGAIGKTFASEAWVKTAATLDEYAAGWIEVHRHICEALSSSAAAEDPRLSCLEERRAEFAALVDALRRPDRDVAMRAVRAASSLSDPRTCERIDALEHRRPRPAAPRLRRDVEQLRDELATARALGYAGRFAESRALTLALAQQAHRLGYDPVAAEVLHQRGVMEYELGDLDGAISTLNEAWIVAESGAHDWMKATSLAVLAGFAGRRHDYEAGHTYLRRTEAVMTRLGEPAELRARLLAAKISLAASEGRVEIAVPWALEALELERARLGDDHPRVLRPTTNAALTLARAGLLDEAEVHAERALTLAKAVYGSDHPDFAVALIAAAEIAQERGSHEIALERARRAAAIQRSAYDDRHPVVADTWTTVAFMATSAKRWEEAEDAYAAALRTARELDDPGRICDISNNLGNLQFTRRRFDEAWAAYRVALQVAERHMGTHHPRVALVCNNLGELASEAGRHAEAVDYHRRALEIRRAAFGAVDPTVARSSTELGEALIDASEPKRAVAVLEDAVELHETLGSPSSTRGQAKFALARALWNLSARGPRERAPERRARALRLAPEILGELEADDPAAGELVLNIRAWVGGLGVTEETAGSETASRVDR